MIDRYTRPEMAAVWSHEHKLETWWAVEMAALDAYAEVGEIPSEIVETIRKEAKWDADRVLAIEEVVKHDVIAFLTAVGEHIGDLSAYVHLGMTSSDVLDTALALQMRQSLDMILDGLDQVRSLLAEQALQWKNTPMIGRSHGIHAEPVTWGLKLALWYSDLGRDRERLVAAREVISVGKISGAVGTFAHLSPEIEERACAHLGLKPAAISTQVLQRDRHAQYLTALGTLASQIEKMAIELRHLQRTEVLEVEESFTKGQKGSSAMPHKRNPISGENLTGLARLVRGGVIPCLENIALWHERDISHSSVERVVLPDVSILMDYMLHRLYRLLKGLVVYPQRMMENLEKTRGLIFSQTVLLALARKGVSREKSYEMVQRNSMKVWEQGGDLCSLLSEDTDVQAVLSREEIAECFDLSRHLRHVDSIFRRVGLM